MKKVLSISSFVFVFSMAFIACKKVAVAPQEDAISQEVLDKIADLGFSNKNVAIHEDGYLVEGDIILTSNDMDRASQKTVLRVGSEEQYRTNNLVDAPRVIDISISSKLPASYTTALDEAISRYNAENLLITMRRVSSNADIHLVSGHGNYLASAGFPSSTGEPYSQVKVNANAIGNQPLGTVATIIAHEIGHCIGFRHTDYLNRQYSCGGSPSNEGASTVGAVHIPGTPTGPDARSWMLSCIGSGQDRPFNANDKTALNYLY